jgi:transposase InsO family protein
MSTPGRWWAGRWLPTCARSSWWWTPWRWLSGGESLLQGSYITLIAEYSTRPLSHIGRRLEEAGVVPSMGRAGSALDNAISESFVASLKCELLHRHRFLSREAARTAVFDYIEGFYNRVRRHSSLGYLSPSDYEQSTMKEVAVA